MAEEITIYHNPRCSKSRQTLQIIRDNGVEPTIVEYLKEMPSKEDLKRILAKLNLGIQDVLRKGEAIYKERFKGKNFTDDEWITIVIENPKLLERPIVVVRDRGVIGRPPENVNNLLN